MKKLTLVIPKRKLALFNAVCSIHNPSNDLKIQFDDKNPIIKIDDYEIPIEVIRD